MKIFMDTNVILDVYYEGRPGKEAALKILQIGNQPLSSRTYLSVLSVANDHLATVAVPVFWTCEVYFA